MSRDGEKTQSNGTETNWVTKDGDWEMLLSYVNFFLLLFNSSLVKTEVSCEAGLSTVEPGKNLVKECKKCKYVDASGSFLT